MKSLKELKGWKIILGIMAGMLLILLLSAVLYSIGDGIRENIYEGYRKDAVEAGYREFNNCTPVGDVTADGITYRCFDVHDEMFGGQMLIDRRVSYKGSGLKGKQIIYGRKTELNDAGTVIEPYVAYAEPVLWDDIGWILIIAIYFLLPVAEAFMAAVLAGYFIVYLAKYIRYKKAAA